MRGDPIPATIRVVIVTDEFAEAQNRERVEAVSPGYGRTSLPSDHMYDWAGGSP